MAKTEKHQLLDGGRWQVWIKAPATEGKANAAIIAYLAKVLGLTKSSIEIKSGTVSSFKTLTIDADLSEVVSRLEATASTS
jgi:uncharacterized protein (TIGR00251 family)